MNKYLKEHLEFADFRLTLANQQAELKDRMNSRLLIARGGATFTINPTLLVYIKTLMDAGHGDYILLANNDIPVMIDDLEAFYTSCHARYYEVISDYYLEYDRLRKIRKAKPIVEFE